MFKLKKLLSLVLIVSLVALMSINITTALDITELSDIASIWSPQGGNSTFILPGQSFTVEVRATEELPLTGWTARLSNDLKSWDAVVTSVTPGLVRYGKEEGYIFTVSTPPNMPPELMDLTLDDGKGGTLTSSRAVKIEQNFEENFYVLHSSDEHIGTGNDRVNNKIYNASVVNLINPRFYIQTGDFVQAYQDVNHWRDPNGTGTLETQLETLHKYKSTLPHYTVPTPMLTGNHDIGHDCGLRNTEWLELFDDIIGPHGFSFKMGSFFVFTYDWTHSSTFNYARNNYLAAWHDPTITYRFVASHNTYYRGPWRHGNVMIDPDKSPNFGVGGHEHATKFAQTNPFPVALITSTESKAPQVAFYNFIKSGDTWTCPQATERVNNVDIFTLSSGFNSSSGQRVKVAYTNNNDGTATTNTATITNQINQNFYNGRVRFLMAKGNYVVTGGTVLAQYDYDSNKTAVVVKVDIKPSTTTTVSIAPASTVAEYKTVLSDMITRYTKPGWDAFTTAGSAFKTALDAATAAVNNANATLSEVQNAINNLKAAADALQPLTAPDKTELSLMITKASGFNASDYTEDSWNEMQEALDAAKAVRNNPNATRAEVDAATINLTNAVYYLYSSRPARTFATQVIYDFDGVTSAMFPSFRAGHNYYCWGGIGTGDFSMTNNMARLNLKGSTDLNTLEILMSPPGVPSIDGEGKVPPPKDPRYDYSRFTNFAYYIDAREFKESDGDLVIRMVALRKTESHSPCGFDPTTLRFTNYTLYPMNGTKQSYTPTGSPGTPDITIPSGFHGYISIPFSPGLKGSEINADTRMHIVAVSPNKAGKYILLDNLQITKPNADPYGWVGAPVDSDKSDLEATIELANSQDEKDYSEQEWTELQNALEAAIIVNDNASSTQEEVDDANNALKKAIKDDSDIIPGDVNEDGDVTSLDALWVLQYASNRKDLTPKQFIAADVNYNGEVSSIDALYILQYVAETRPSLEKPA